MNIKKLNDLEYTVAATAVILMSVLLIMYSSPESVLIRTLVLTVISMSLLALNRNDETKKIKFFFDFFVMILLLANKIKTTGDLIRGVTVYNLPEIPTVNRISVGCFLILLLFILGLYFYLYLESYTTFKHAKKYTNEDAPKIAKIGPDIFLIMMIFYAISLIASATARPIFDFFVTKQFDYYSFQNYLLLSGFEGIISLMPMTFFYFSMLRSLRPEEYERGDFLVTSEHMIVKYKGKNKRIYVPKDLSIYLTDTFLECDSTYEIWFEEGTTELPPLKFKKSIPNIHYPSSLQNIREYSLFIKGENPFENTTTITKLLNNPVFKVIDGCMVNTKTKTLLFVIDHDKNEFKLPDCIEKIGRFAFDDLNLGKYYKLRKNPDYDTSSFVELYKKHNNFSNGSDKEYLLNAAETVLCRVQLEKIYLHKNIKYIDSEAFELATGLREVYVPEEADYDLAEMISTRPYIKYLGKGKKITHRMIERLLQIHSKIKSGCYPNSKQLAYDLETSEPTINRDIEYLRDSRGAPIEYDHVNRGYYYTEDYELFFDK